MARKILVFFLLAAAMCGCKDAKLQPFVGMWRGGFVPSKEQDPGVKPQPWSGYLQLYINQEKFLMHLESPQVIIDFSGNYAVKGDRATLTLKDMKVDTREGDLWNEEDAKIKLAQDIQNQYGKELVFNLSTDKKRLVGLEMHVGKTVGHHEFEKNSEGP